MDWVDVALIANERDLQALVDRMNETERDDLIRQISALLGTSISDLQRALLRTLIERARPFALPMAVWARPITATTDITEQLKRNFANLDLAVTSDRLRRAQELYAKFASERTRTPITLRQLTNQGFRCGHCGLAFCNEELASRGFVSPFGVRGLPKTDPLKPHWHSAKNRLPTMDHDWPVSLYGSNDSQNLRIMCQACNNGKADYLSLEQTRAFTGLPIRSQLLGQRPVPPHLFYAQLRYQPLCENTGKDATQTELTIELRYPDRAAVLDNLRTVESIGV